MALGGISAAWDSTKPANTDQIGSGDDQIRSDKTNLQGALNSEHNFPEGGGSSVGYHLLGSARAFVGNVSAVSSAGTDGRLMVASNRSQFFHVGSDGTMLLGSRDLLQLAGFEAGATGTLTQRHQWKVVHVSSTMPSSGSELVSGIGTSAFSGRPFVWGQAGMLNAQVASPTLVALRTFVNASGVSVYMLDGSGLTGNIGYAVMSIGSVLIS